MKFTNLFFTLVILIPGIARAQNFQSMMNQLVHQSRIKNSDLGLVIASPNGRILAQLNSRAKMTPASLTKIVTAAAVLEKMPIGHQFETTLLSSAPVVNGVLEGPLYLRGGGDPGFVSQTMWCLVDTFLRTGIKKINGNIVVDDSRFDDVRFDPSRDQTLIDRAYDAPIGAMTFNWSAVNVFVRPGFKVGAPARVYVDPQNTYIRLVNRARTSRYGRTRLSVINENIKNDHLTGHHETVVVSGEIPLGAPEFVAYRSIVHPAIWSGYQLKAFLRERGITVTGAVRHGKTPRGAKILAVQKSKPIDELVSEMMKYSNNFMAEILTKDLGVQEKGPPGTMDKGMAVIHEFLNSLHFKPQNYVMISPSGISHKNKFRPIDLLRVLEHVRRRFEIYPEYVSSLPIGGVDGTLRIWLRGTEHLGVVRAKTGTLDGVVGLGGYVGTRSGHLYEFVFLFNGTPTGAGRARILFGSLVSDLLKQG